MQENPQDGKTRAGKPAGRRSYKVKDLAGLLGCEYEGDGDVVIRGVASLENAAEGDIVFAALPKFRAGLEATKASAAILPPGEKFHRIPVLKANNPQRTFVKAVEILVPADRPAPGVHPTAVVAPTARIAAGASIGAMSAIGDGADIGENTVIHPLVSIYPRVKIGRDCVIHSHVSVREAVRIGDRVIIHGGTIIGSDGYGYLKDADGTQHKIPQVGTVIIEDDVEIGANSTVDRAALDATVIRRGVKIDNLVMVAHNVEVGENSLLMAQVGIAGSSKVGKSAVLAGQVGITDHVKIGDNVVIAAQTGVRKDIPEGSFVAGSPHLDINDWRKVCVLLPQLHDLFKDFKKLKERVEELEGKK